MRWILPVLAFVGVLAGCAGPPNRTDLPDNENAAGRKLYYAKCAKCHKFYDPAKYSDEEWKVWMRKMGKKSKLTPEQQRTLSLYIERTYRSERKSDE